VTNSRGAGAVTESLLNTSQDLGNSTAPDVKQQINKFSELDKVLDSYEPAKKNNGSVCSVSKIYDVLPDETKERLDRLMDNKAITSGELSKLLKTFDLFVSVEVLRRHRRRRSGTGCACP
jgi:predicted DNA-binding protein